MPWNSRAIKCMCMQCVPGSFPLAQKSLGTRLFYALEWENEGNDAKIEGVLTIFEQHCWPRKNVPFELYRFNQRIQEPGETYNQYRTALRKITEKL